MERTTTNIIVRIQRPDLSPTERARRMEQIKKAATRLLIAAEQAKHA